MRVLITGANGMVARAAIGHCTALSDEVIAVSHGELDVSQREKVFKTIEGTAPEAVLNCAAFTDVDGAETNEDAAYAANAAGPENLAAACKEFGATLVTISTDYVFDGTKDGFYTQDDQPNPQSAYARSKYEGELRSAAANPQSIIVRSGWIFGHGGTNFLSVVPELAAKGKRFKAIADSFGTPTFADDLAVRLRQLAVARAAGIFHATNSGDGTTYYQFAVTAAEALGAGSRMIERVSNTELKRPAARPRNSRLKCIRSNEVGLAPLRDWIEALNAFLNEKGGK